ncbi:hypothetical protein [Kitasatospora sp. NPDC059160]|uniref:hypothetical protein n=1 Tax=Kitasatospora sp. NPDC059160 TaxID=3346748 RepID=UPI0036BF234D
MAVDVPEEEHVGELLALAGSGAELDSPWHRHDGQNGRARAVAGRATCSCGWRGEMVALDFADRAVTDGVGSEWYTAWEQHLAHVAGDQVPEDVLQLIAQLRRRLQELTVERPLAGVRAADQVERMGRTVMFDAVKAARAGRASWQDVGDAARVSRQTAHQRFAALMDAPTGRGVRQAPRRGEGTGS